MKEKERLAVQYADCDCAVFHGLSLPELMTAGAACLLASLVLAVPLAFVAGLWLLPLILFAGVAGGIRLCAAAADHLRDGKPRGWLERQLAWQLRHWLLPAAFPADSGQWIPWRLSS